MKYRIWNDLERKYEKNCDIILRSDGTMHFLYYNEYSKLIFINLDKKDYIFELCSEEKIKEQELYVGDIIKYGEFYGILSFGRYGGRYYSQYHCMCEYDKNSHLGFYVDWKNNDSLRTCLGFWIDTKEEFLEIIGNVHQINIEDLISDD